MTYLSGVARVVERLRAGAPWIRGDSGTLYRVCGRNRRSIIGGFGRTPSSSGRTRCGRCCGISVLISLTLSSETLMQGGQTSSGALGMS